jgi:hypothetical protein
VGKSHLAENSKRAMVNFPNITNKKLKRYEGFRLTHEADDTAENILELNT